MKATGLQLISQFWEQLCDEQFNLAEFSAALHESFGYDGSSIAPEDIASALTLPTYNNWANLGWTCREQIACYVAAEECSCRQYVEGIACACLLSEAIRRGYYGWGNGSIDSIIELVYRNIDKGHSLLRADFFIFLFGS